MRPIHRNDAEPEQSVPAVNLGGLEGDARVDGTAARRRRDRGRAAGSEPVGRPSDTVDRRGIGLVGRIERLGDREGEE
ncbi:MAG: hypothetical protein ABR569_10120 [Gaiellaceae bacterium]